MRGIKQALKTRWRRFSLTYLGALPAGTYERYGTRGVRWSWYFSSMSVPIAIVVFFLSNNVSKHQLTIRDDTMAHLDFNRQKFYDRDAGFRPETIDKFTTIYDSTRGFVQMDHITGIHKTTENKYAGPSKKELEERLSKVNVTPEMVEKVRQLRDHITKDGDAPPSATHDRPPTSVSHALPPSA